MPLSTSFRSTILGCLSIALAACAAESKEATPAAELRAGTPAPPGAPPPRAEEQKAPAETSAPADCNALASAKASGSFVVEPGATSFGSLSRAVDVIATERVEVSPTFDEQGNAIGQTATRSITVTFSTLPNAYIAAGATGSTVELVGYTAVKRSADATPPGAFAPGEYADYFGFAGGSTCHGSDTQGTSGTFLQAGVVRLVAVGPTSVEGVIEVAPGDRVSFKAPIETRVVDRPRCCEVATR